MASTILCPLRQARPCGKHYPEASTTMRQARFRGKCGLVASTIQWKRALWQVRSCGQHEPCNSVANTVLWQVRPCGAATRCQGRSWLECLQYPQWYECHQQSTGHDTATAATPSWQECLQYPQWCECHQEPMGA